MEYEVKYGKRKLNFRVPDENVIATLLPKKVEPLSDFPAAVAAALQSPLGTPPLRKVVRPGDKVVIVINDITRVVNTHMFLPLLLNELNAAGVPDKDIQAVVATGCHRPQTSEEHLAILGEEGLQRIKVTDHVATDTANLVYVGETSRGNKVYINRIVAEADKVILTGEVTYHMTAGYTGGRKSVLPGVAGLDSITFNHRFMLHPSARQGILVGNPLHEDMLEAARLVKPAFTFNVILNAERKFVKVLAGEMEAVHREGVRLVDELFAVKIGREADVVIANCGGYPKDIEFYQSQKTLDNATRAVRQGGTVILLAACPEGHGSKVFYEHMKKFTTPDEVVAYAHKDFKMGEHKAFLTARLLCKADVILISEMPDSMVRELMMTPARTVDEALQMVREKYGPDYSAYVMPEGFLTVPFLA